MTALPLFPLNVVLFPTMVLPLHIFEPRYRALIHDVLEGDKQFGVVLIERGRDTGGEDQRTDFGTIAKVIEAEEFPDGRWGIVTVGTERFRITNWLPDGPYPQAQVECWPDDVGQPLAQDRFVAVASKFRRCMAMASEAGVDVGPIPELAAPDELATMQMAAMLPIGTFDKQRLLGMPSCGERLAALDVAIDETLELIDIQLRSG